MKATFFFFFKLCFRSFTSFTNMIGLRACFPVIIIQIDFKQHLQLNIHSYAFVRKEYLNLSHTKYILTTPFMISARQKLICFVLLSHFSRVTAQIHSISIP